MPGSPIPYVGLLPCPEKFFTLKSVNSVAVLDEGAVPPLQKLAAGRPVVTFPDFTDIHLPPKGDSAWGLANKIRECARGRPVVSLVGHLQTDKGNERIYERCQRCSEAGKVWIEDFDHKIPMPNNITVKQTSEGID